MDSKSREEIMRYRRLYTKLLSMEYEERSDAITKLEELGTKEAIDILIKCLLSHPGEIILHPPRSEFALPLLRMWEIAPEKTIPVMPEIIKHINYYYYDSYDVYNPIFNEMMKKELLFEIFKQGLSDYDYTVRQSSIDLLNEKLGNEIIPLLIDYYKLEEEGENGGLVIDSINNALMSKKNEENIPKIVPFFLRELAEEKDEEYQKSIQAIIIDLVTPFAKNIDQLLTKEDIEQLQTLGIIKN